VKEHFLDLKMSLGGAICLVSLSNPQFNVNMVIMHQLIDLRRKVACFQRISFLLIGTKESMAISLPSIALVSY
jgi:hypothetical protein